MSNKKSHDDFKTYDGFDESWLSLDDYNGRDRGSPRPFLLFDPKDGKLIIADDYEISNDPTARDFGLSRDDALKLARALQRYAKNRTPSERRCVDQYDVEQALRDDGRF
jgi:hypothetical protein